MLCMKKSKSYDIFSTAVLTVVCCGAKLYGIMPFGAPMFCALAAPPASARAGSEPSPQGKALLAGVSALLYVLCEYLFTFELNRLYISGAAAVVMLLYAFVAIKSRKFRNEGVKTAFSFVALAVRAALFCVFESVMFAAVDFAVAAAFYYFARRISSLAAQRFAFKPSAPDATAVCAALFAAGLAFGRAQVGEFVIGLAPAYFCALFACMIGAMPLLLCGVSVGIGLAVSVGINTGFSFAACALAVAAFRTLPRPIYALLGIGTFSAFSVLFGISPRVIGWSALMCLAGALPVCVLPRRSVRALGEYFDFDGCARLGVRHYINRVKADAGDRMLRLAAVFDETARLMNAFEPQAPDFAALGAVLSDKVCPYCPKRGVCDRQSASAAFAEVARSAYENKPVIAGLPEFFAENCAKIPEVTSSALSVAQTAHFEEKENECDRKAKAIVTERLTAVREVLSELGNFQALPVGFDDVAEKRVAQELALSGIECADAFVTRDGVTAVVRSERAEREKIRKAVSTALKSQYVLTELDNSRAAGWSVASLKKRPTFEAVYARAGVAKNGVSGDSYTFKRIGDKFLVALCDGMGTGSNASADSAAAVELVECFYKAGFDSNSVLTGVNRFLKLPGSERYSAADIAVCDLSTATTDIIKIGAPPCFIKTADTVLKIEGSSLPIGVLDEMRPFVTSKRLYPGQMYISVSDGVSDRFDGDELPAFINGLSARNPAAAANAVLSRALELSGGTPRDDMTVLAFRLFENKGKGKVKIKN